MCDIIYISIYIYIYISRDLCDELQYHEYTVINMQLCNHNLLIYASNNIKCVCVCVYFPTYILYPQE